MGAFGIRGIIGFTSLPGGLLGGFLLVRLILLLFLVR